MEDSEVALVTREHLFSEFTGKVRVHSTLPNDFKKGVFSSDYNHFRVLQKKFAASRDMKFMFVSFVTIISDSQNKRDGRTTLRSDSMGGKASK